MWCSNLNYHEFSQWITNYWMNKSIFFFACTEEVKIRKIYLLYRSSNKKKLWGYVERIAEEL